MDTKIASLSVFKKSFKDEKRLKDIKETKEGINKWLNEFIDMILIKCYHFIESKRNKKLKERSASNILDTIKSWYKIK